MRRSWIFRLIAQTIELKLSNEFIDQRQQKDNGTSTKKATLRIHPDLTRRDNARANTIAMTHHTISPIAYIPVSQASVRSG